MPKKKKVKIINGDYKGKTGYITAMLWASGIALISIDGKEIAFKFTEFKTVYDT